MATLRIMDTKFALIHYLDAFYQKSRANQKAIALDFMTYVLLYCGIVEYRVSLTTQDITHVGSFDKHCIMFALTPLAIRALYYVSA